MTTEAARLIQVEDTVLHDQWKLGGGGSTFFGQVVSNSEYAAKTEYVRLANGWLSQSAAAIGGKKGTAAELATLERLYVKILSRRDDLVERGVGRISPTGEDDIAQVAQKVIPDGPDLDRVGKYILAGLALVLVIVILK